MVFKSKLYKSIVFTTHFRERLQQRRNIKTPKEYRNFVKEIEQASARHCIREGKEMIEIITQRKEKIILSPSEEDSGVYKAVTYVDTRKFGSALYFSSPIRYNKNRGRRKQY